MTNKKVTRRALVMSVTSLLICISMLLGTTFAWFTDEVTSGVNKIIAGNLDVEVYHKTTGTSTELGEKVDGETKLFNTPASGTSILWEPGAMAYEVFTVKNVGTLALKYNMRLNAIGNNFVVEAGETAATERSLLDVLRVAVVDSALASPTREGIAAANYTWTTLKDFAIAVQDIELLPAAQKQFTVILYWPSDTETISALAGTAYTDNDYNLKNGAKASDAGTDQVGQLYVDLGVTLVATQLKHEADSFDNTYDQSATMPADGWEGVNTANMVSATAKNKVDVSTTGTPDGNKTTYAAQNTTVTDTATNVTASVPASALADYAKTVEEDTTQGTTTTKETELELTVVPTAASNAVATVETAGTSSTALYYDIDLTAITTTTVTNTSTAEVTNSSQTSTAVSATSDVIEVALPIGENYDLQAIYHKTTLLTTTPNADGEYYTYANGVLTLYVKTFSPFSIAYKFAGGLGTEVAPYLIANRDHLEAISDEENCAYYKMAEKNAVIDATGMPFIVLNGCFDGNGLTVNNLSRCLFYETNNGNAPCVIKNVTVNANIARNSYFESAVVLYPDNDILFENVNVHGYIEGTAPASYIALGPYEVINYTFINCYSDATIVATGESAAGFIAHPYCKDGSSITLQNSKYTGAMAAVGNTYYFRVNASGALTITTDETDGGSLYTNPAASYTSNADLYTSGGVKYKAGTKVTINNLTKPENVQTLSVEKAEGAAYAIATLNIGPNGTDEKGNYMGVFMKENCTIEDGCFVTTDIKNFTVTVNGSATSETGISSDGTTYNIVRSSYGTTYGSAFVRIIQYNEAGGIINISNLNLKA